MPDRRIDLASDEAPVSLALLDALFATAPVGLGLWDRDLRYLRVNRRLADMNGLAPGEHVGVHLHVEALRKPGHVLLRQGEIDINGIERLQ